MENKRWYPPPSFCRQHGLSGLLILTVLASIIIAGVLLFQKRISHAMALYKDEGSQGILLKIKDTLPIATPNVQWETATPESEGIDGTKLRALSARLAFKGTHAFIVVRHNKIVHEYYGPNQRPDKPHFIAAMGKLVTATMAVSLNIADRRMSLDDPLRKYIPAWNDDPSKYPITVRHILTHSSGIENVSFTRKHEGWKQVYLQNPERRFDLVIRKIPVTFTPGSHYGYSGVGFYALAYALGKSLTNAPQTNVRELLRYRLMTPLGIPPHDWSISYNESYSIEGMKLYAIGSGGSYTPRALARIGQLLVNGGRWKDRQLIPQSIVKSVLSFGASPPRHSPQEANPATGLGLWLNCDGYWPALPPDAAVAAGGGHQILLMIPSLGLVAVRLGKPLGKDRWEGDYWTALGTRLFNPLINTIRNYASPPPHPACEP